MKLVQLGDGAIDLESIREITRSHRTAWPFLLTWQDGSKEFISQEYTQQILAAIAGARQYPGVTSLQARFDRLVAAARCVDGIRTGKSSESWKHDQLMMLHNAVQEVTDDRTGTG